MAKIQGGPRIRIIKNKVLVIFIHSKILLQYIVALIYKLNQTTEKETIEET